MLMKQVLIIELVYPYGYCKIGQRFYALKSGKRSERVSWIAALKEGSLFAPMTNATVPAIAACLRCG